MSSFPSDNYGARGAGRTHRQLERAPHGCVYVCVTMHQALIFRSYGACQGKNIRFVSIDTALGNDAEFLRGLRGPDAVMLDHSVWDFMGPNDRNPARRAMGERWLEIKKERGF